MQESGQSYLDVTRMTPLLHPLWIVPLKERPSVTVGSSSSHAPQPSVRMRSIDSDGRSRADARGCLRQKSSPDS